MAARNGRNRLRSPSLSEASDVSDLSDEENHLLSSSPILTEAQVFKPAESDLDPDDYPIFFLEDVTIVDEKPQQANLLQSAPGKIFLVTGRLMIDEDDEMEKKDLKYRK